MQLKKDEQEVLQETNETQIDNQPDALTNNDFLNQEKEFDVEGDGIFDSFTPYTPYESDGSGAQGAPNDLDNQETINDSYNPNSDTVNIRPRKLTKKEFFDSPRNRKDRDRIIISSIVIAVAAIFDVVRTDFWLSALKKQIEFVNDLSTQFGLEEEYYIDTQKIMNTQIIMSVILIAAAVGIFVLKSRACAATGLALTLINCVSTLISTGKFRWYWTIIAFGYAVAATFSFANAWKNYEENGDWKKDW